MSRLIDADAYSIEMKKRQDEALKWKEMVKQSGDTECYHRALGAIATFCEAKLTLDNMPTIDAVEVVRCKECKHRKDSIQCPLCSEGIATADDWFCGDGEEREVQ